MRFLEGEPGNLRTCLDVAGSGVGGRCEIRTHGAVADTPDFKSGALDHSANLPFPSSDRPSGHGAPAATAGVAPARSAARLKYAADRIGEALSHAAASTGAGRKLRRHRPRVELG